MTIPEPTPDDLRRDAKYDYGSKVSPLPWIRRAVAAERERDEARKAILAFGNNPAGFDWAVLTKLDSQERRIKAALNVLDSIDLIILSEDGTLEHEPTFERLVAECAYKIPHLRNLHNEAVVLCDQLFIECERCKGRIAKLEAEIERERDEARTALADAQIQLAYLWHDTGRCPCGARRKSPASHPHSVSCPTAVAIKREKEICK